MQLPSGANLREHWAVRSKRIAQHREVGRRIGSSYEWGGGPIEILLHRVGKRELDDDNLAYAFKGIRDGIADGLGLDNGNDHRIIWLYAQSTGKEACIRVQFRESLA